MICRFVETRSTWHSNTPSARQRLISYGGLPRSTRVLGGAEERDAQMRTRPRPGGACATVDMPSNHEAAFRRRQARSSCRKKTPARPRHARAPLGKPQSWRAPSPCSVVTERRPIDARQKIQSERQATRYAWRVIAASSPRSFHRWSVYGWDRPRELLDAGRRARWPANAEGRARGGLCIAVGEEASRYVRSEGKGPSNRQLNEGRERDGPACVPGTQQSHPTLRVRRQRLRPCPGKSGASSRAHRHRSVYTRRRIGCLPPGTRDSACAPGPRGTSATVCTALLCP